MRCSNQAFRLKSQPALLVVRECVCDVQARGDKRTDRVQPAVPTLARQAGTRRLPRIPYPRDSRSD